jgi:hypothetical protein
MDLLPRIDAKIIYLCKLARGSRYQSVYIWAMGHCDARRIKLRWCDGARDRMDQSVRMLCFMLRARAACASSRRGRLRGVIMRASVPACKGHRSADLTVTRERSVMCYTSFDPRPTRAVGARHTRIHRGAASPATGIFPGEDVDSLFLGGAEPSLFLFRSRTPQLTDIVRQRRLFLFVPAMRCICDSVWRGYDSFVPCIYLQFMCCLPYNNDCKVASRGKEFHFDGLFRVLL